MTPTPYDMDIFWLKANRPLDWREKVRRLVALASAYRNRGQLPIAQAKGG